MDDNQTFVPPHSPLIEDRSTGRRKVRKGTQSCWECKRRKIRCIFSGPQTLTCDGCRRRGKACVSQEYPDVGNGAPSDQLGARLDRIEAILGRLVENIGSGNAPYSSEKLVSTVRPKSPVQLQFTTRNASRFPDHGAENACSPLVDSWGEPFVASGDLSNETNYGLDPMKSPDVQHELVSPLQRVVSLPRQLDLTCSLLAAWPSAHDLEIILSVPFETSVCFHGLGFIQGSPYQCKKAPTGQDLLQLPPQGSPMLLFARKLLILGTYLQALPPGVLQRLEHHGLDCKSIMAQAVIRAHSLVTCNDELLDSVEGVECLAIEGLYYSSSGSLRRAWLTIRRAMLIAQMIGLHKIRRPPPRIGPEPIACNVPGHMWFRLVRLDRYFSLMLGLPQSSPHDELATLIPLETCTPMERLQRIHCTVAGRILQRSEAENGHDKEIEEIDKLLREASRCMPPQWWLVPDFALDPNGRMNNCDELIRLIDQFTHYHLILRLHLPYLLRFSTAPQHEYSKHAALYASREILSRFTAFRAAHAGGTYCRNIDYLVFIACIALCLTYIDGYGRKHAQGESLLFSSLAHQRNGDRGMMERALESVESMARAGDDSTAKEIAQVMRYLLSIEKGVAEGGNYTTASLACDQGSSCCNGNIAETNNGSLVNIPTVGTFDIVRFSISDSASTIESQQRFVPIASVAETCLPDQWAPSGFYPTLGAGIASIPTGNNNNDQLVSPRLDSESVQLMSIEEAQVVRVSTPTGRTGHTGPCPESTALGQEAQSWDLDGMNIPQYLGTADFDHFLTQNFRLQDG